MFLSSYLICDLKFRNETRVVFVALPNTQIKDIQCVLSDISTVFFFYENDNDGSKNWLSFEELQRLSENLNFAPLSPDTARLENKVKGKLWWPRTWSLNQCCYTHLDVLLWCDLLERDIPFCEINVCFFTNVTFKSTWEELVLSTFGVQQNRFN